jgi:hypothetical protein
MLDCSSAGRMESAPLPALVDKWLPAGMIAHVQVNDRNRRGPGQGEQRFAPVLAALVRHGYAGDVAVEPFDYVPDGPGAAARAIGYIRGILEALQVDDRTIESFEELASSVQPFRKDGDWISRGVRQSNYELF